MNKSERAKFIIDALNEAYPETPIPLNHKDVYTLLIAVLLSAQCTDKRVNEVTPELFALASDPLSMTKLSVESIYEIIKPCGLGPKKSKAISDLSYTLVHEYRQKVPES
jgi:Predicted EndoIII-related endonuclease